MQNAAILPERSPEAGEVEFTSAREAIRAFLCRTAGKAAVITDAACCGLALEALGGSRAVTVVFEGDALPLFALPEVGAAIAVGGGATLRACRFFAEIMHIPCLLLPVGAALDGVAEEAGEIVLDGELRTVPLKRGETVFDKTLLSEGLAAAESRLLLTRLALFETQMLVRFGLRSADAASERLYAALLEEGEDLPSLVKKNFAARTCEAEGMPCGEGILLSRMLRGVLPEYSAFITLLSLYKTFFSEGALRRYTVPDYRRRARDAGVPYGDLCIPTPQELMRREEVFLGMRGEALCLLSCVERAHAHFLRRHRPKATIKPIGGLPERSGGLSALIRDFGLLEFA